MWKGLGQNGMNGWKWIVKLPRMFTSWNHIEDDSSVSFGIGNEQQQNKQTNDTGCHSMVLLQSHKQKRIPDTNRWIYTNLLKQKWISEATQWSYTNLLTKWNLDTGCQSVWTYTNIQHMIIGKQMPTYRDLQLHPHIQSSASSKDKMSGQGDGLMLTSIL